MKFGKRLLRTITIMPFQYKEGLFLDYKMLKKQIKLFVKALSTSSRDNEPPALPVSGLSHDHGWELGNHQDGHQDAGTTASMDCRLEDMNLQDLDFDDAFLFGPLTWSDRIVMCWRSTGMAYGISEDSQPMLVACECVQDRRREVGGRLQDNFRQSLNWNPTVEEDRRRQELEGRLQENFRQPLNWNSAVEDLRMLEGRLEENLRQPLNRNSGVEEDVQAPAVEEDKAFLYELFHSTVVDNTDVHLRYQTTVFKRLLDAEFTKINKLFVTRFQHNSALIGKLDLMRREEEAKQYSLHSSIVSWDASVLKTLRWRMVNLYVDFRILEYSSRINYEASVKIMKKHDKCTGSNLRWNYLRHVEAQDFYVLQSEFDKYAKQCRHLMSVGVFQHLSPMSDEELHHNFAPLVAMCMSLDREMSLATMEQSSTRNSQSLHPPSLFIN